MEEVTKFKAKNGFEFNDRHECLKYEALIEEVETIISELPSKPDLPGCEFENGAGFIQHDPSVFKRVKSNLLNVCKRYFNHDWVSQTQNDDTIHPGWVSRLLGDAGIQPLMSGWHRIECTDKKFREWGQPYFASHPEQGKQIQLN